MEALFTLGVLLGMLAALSLNIGKGIQKQKVHVLLEGRQMLSAAHRRDLGIWLTGLAMTAASALPYSLGLKLTGSPSTISAMTGIGLVGLAIYAWKVIGEKIGPRDLVGITMVVAGTSLLSYLTAGQEPQQRQVSDLSLMAHASPLLVLSAAACVTALFWRKIHGVAFGLAAGVCIGMAIFVGDVALVRAGGSFSGQLSTPYPYVALGLAFVAMAVTQLGFFRGRALAVVPALNSAAVLTPLLLEVSIYRLLPRPVTLVPTAVIIAGVLLISRGAAARAWAGEGGGKAREPS